jgi:hypothetical protein
MMRYDAVRMNTIEIDGDLSDWDCHEYKAQTPFYPMGVNGQGTCVGTYAGGCAVTTQSYQGTCQPCDRLLTFDVFQTIRTWTGADDQASAVAIAWDSEYLYTAVKVFDDDHWSRCDYDAGWNGDSVQVLFTDALQDNILFEFNIALTPCKDGASRGQRAYGKPVRWSDHIYIGMTDCEADALCAKQVGRDNFTNANASIVRDEALRTTIYELKLPASVFGANGLVDGMQLGIGVAVNDGDNDGGQQGEGGWSGWGSYAPIFGKTPGDTGLVTLRGTSSSCKRQAPTAPSSFRAAVAILTNTAWLGANAYGGDSLQGSLAMFQVYNSAMTQEQISCVYESGRQLVQSGRMSQPATSECHGYVHTGCTSLVASNRPKVRANPLDQQAVNPSAMVDDGSCVFDKHSGVSECGIIDITDSWQHVTIRGTTFTQPLVFFGVLTRQSTALAVVRLRGMAMDASGVWSFEVRAEQKSCHFADPPPTAERVSYLVVEAGVSVEGWQAGQIRVHNREWSRVSMLQPFDSDAAGKVSVPVVVSLVQNFDERALFVSTRHNLWPALSSVDASMNAPYQAFFIQVQGDGVWCPDGHYYAEYFDNLKLGGTPLAVLCETTIPDWQWHSCCSGVPPAMLTANSHTFIFSARWTSRIRVQTDEQESKVSFSTHASSGSRILLDGTTVVDKWEECCSKFDSDSITIDQGYHVLTYEYRSAASREAAPTDSYAVLALSLDSGMTGLKLINDTLTLPQLYTQPNAIETDAAALHADVAWLAFMTGYGTMNGRSLHAGYATTTSDLTISVDFGHRFAVAPMVFAGLISTDSLSGHLRLLTASEGQFSLATEYDTCNFVVNAAETVISWIAIPSGHDKLNAAVVQHPTNSSDTGALLRIRELLSLPDYLQWHNGSDPCGDRWAGIECRARAGEDMRVVVLDVRVIPCHLQYFDLQYCSPRPYHADPIFFVYRA